MKRILAYAGAGLIFIIGFFALWVSSLSIPNLDSFEQRRVIQSTKIYDRTGENLLYDVYTNVRRTVVPFESISPNIKKATLAIEDINFYDHGGVRPTSIARAFLVNATSMSFSQGGSTITQQVVKNSLLSKDKTISRKLKELVLSLKLEKAVSKDVIFSTYLNEIPYGGSVYGVEEASKEFFGKKSSDVTLAEAAYLAAIPKAPTYYSPYGTHLDRLNARKNLVLREMLENGLITQEEHDSAKEEKVEFKPSTASNIKAPHFVMYVKEYLTQKYGEEMVESGGLKVITTLDLELQQAAEQIVQRYAEENKVRFNASNAAMVAIDPKTGGIITMVGSRNYFDTEIDGNFNVAVARTRQPGSSFKPIVYAAAFNKGYTPETVVFDVPTQFSAQCDAFGKPLNPSANPSICYMPSNYDDAFRGPVTLRNALAQSLNIPAIKTLYLTGLRESLALAKDMGIEGLNDPNRYGLTLVLGGGEVSLLDLTGAYSTFANEGLRNPYTPVLRVEDPHGVVLEELIPAQKEVLPRNTALTISSILSDNVARTPLYGANSLLYFPGRDVAAKTGTTNDYRDAWILGYTPQIAVGAWAGNNDNSPMEKKVAGMIVAPMWHEFMAHALSSLPPLSFEPPAQEDKTALKPILKGIWQGGQTYTIDSATGKLATSLTPEETKMEKAITNVHSILYWLNKDDPRGPAPSNPEQDPQFTLWETPVRAWAEANNMKDQDASIIPTQTDDVHTPDAAPRVTINTPSLNQKVIPGEPSTITVSTSGKFPISKVEYFINGASIGSSNRAPFSFTFTPIMTPGISQHNELKAVVYDRYMNRGEAVSNFSLR